MLEEPKRDGISCELKYENGKLYQAVTRGDGEAGEDMTAQVKHCKAIPQTIPLKYNVRVRGELVMRNSELARINALGGKQYANSRNLTAGTMKNDDLKIVESRNVVLVPWDMYSPNEDEKLPDSAYDRMKLLESFGFPKYEGVRVPASEIRSALKDMLTSIKGTDITADGVVIKVDSHKLRNKLGVGTKYTKYQHCFKPQNLAAETTLLSIEYGLGRTGKVTPVAILAPVNLGGAMISRATLCNETYMENLGIMLGATVKILRSGDVIPFICGVTNTKNAKPYVFPTVCPSCGSKLKSDLTTEIVQRFCENSACPGKASEQFAYIANRETLEIDCLGDSMAAELVAHKVVDIANLFEFGNDVTSNKWNAKFLANDLGFRSGVNTLKMVKSLENAKKANWSRWFAAISIPFIGHSLGKDIAIALNLTSEDMKSLPKLLLKLPALNLNKLGPVKTTSIVDWAKNPNNIALCDRLYNAGVRPSVQSAPIVAVGAKLAGIKFVITGTLSGGTRKEISAKLVAIGAEELSAVSSSCNLLIVGEDAGSKLEKAKKKGIKIVDESWVNEVLGVN
jgi:DNA ligase (NAD+)